MRTINQKDVIRGGVYSACTANSFVLEAVMQENLKLGKYAVIEATANQVNQFGGYTGMKPADFVNLVNRIAAKVNFPIDRIILGGDHLGPLTWTKESSKTAMEKAAELIRQYVLAGFTKIHIDTSMKLADDPKDCALDTKVIAERGAFLCQVAEKAFAELKQSNPLAVSPVYIVGSEVPIPGGAQEAEEGIQVTKPADFEMTVLSFMNAFKDLGLDDAWQRVIAVVVQPGVEFGSDIVHEYNPEAARALIDALEKYPNLVFEGHSTDYQTASCLRAMVDDGIKILKVGPALTFALREGLFALAHIEEQLLKGKSGVQLSNFIEVLDNAMLENPVDWKKHYHGTDEEIAFARKFSLSDRCRYYLPVPEVQAATELLLNNLNVDIPLSLISQFMPEQYKRVRSGLLKPNANALLLDRIATGCIEDYNYATK